MFFIRDVLALPSTTIITPRCVLTARYLPIIPPHTKRAHIHTYVCTYICTYTLYMQRSATCGTKGPGDGRDPTTTRRVFADITLSTAAASTLSSAEGGGGPAVAVPGWSCGRAGVASCPIKGKRVTAAACKGTDRQQQQID